MGQLRARTISSIAGLFALCLLASSEIPMRGQAGPERFWLAGRYDGNHVIVYFDALKIGDAWPQNTEEIAPPIADAFFAPFGLPADFVGRLQAGGRVERFNPGDRYDLLVGNGMDATITLATFVGFQGDESVGNNSFLGALATPDRVDRLRFTKDYYAVRRHVERPAGEASPRFDPNTVVSLDDGPVPFAVETRAAALLTERMKKEPADSLPRDARSISPAVLVQRFTLADGTPRYYARAEWRRNRLASPIYAVGAWLAPSPQLHVAAWEPTAFSRLLNVVDLGGGRVGVIAPLERGDGRGIELAEFADGANLAAMRSLHSFGVTAG